MLDADVAPSECWTRTGAARTRPTNSTKSFWSTQCTRPSALTLTPIGYVNLWWSIVSCAVRPQLASAREAWARVTDTARPSVVQSQPTGRADSDCKCTESDRGFVVGTSRKQLFYYWLVLYLKLLLKSNTFKVIWIELSNNKINNFENNCFFSLLFYLFETL